MSNPYAYDTTHTVYILDWQGTLDTVSNPKGFVRALQHLGHRVVMWSGHSMKDHPAWAAVDAVCSKYDSLKEIITWARSEWKPKKIIISDDYMVWSGGDEMTELQTNPSFGTLTIEFLKPSELGNHLSQLSKLPLTTQRVRNGELPPPPE